MKKNIIFVILLVLMIVLALLMIFKKDNKELNNNNNNQEENVTIPSINYTCEKLNETKIITVDDTLDEKVGDTSSANMGDIKINTKLTMKFYEGYASMDVEETYKFDTKEGYDNYKFSVINANFEDKNEELTKILKYSINEIKFQDDKVDDLVIENFIKSYKSNGYSCNKE